MSLVHQAAQTVNQIIELRLESLLTDTPVSWPNRPFTRPTDGAWVKVDVLWGNGTMTTKDGLNTHVGILQLGIFQRKSLGDGPMWTLAEELRADFNRWRSGDVCFGACPAPRWDFEDDALRVATISAPFTFGEVVPLTITWLFAPASTVAVNTPLPLFIAQLSRNGVLSDGVLQIQVFSGPGSLLGTVVMPTVAGFATWTDISFDTAGDYTLGVNPSDDPSVELDFSVTVTP